MTEFGNKTGLMQIPKIQTYPDCLLNVRRNLAKSRWTYFKFSFLSLFFFSAHWRRLLSVRKDALRGAEVADNPHWRWPLVTAQPSH